MRRRTLSGLRIAAAALIGIATTIAAADDTPVDPAEVEAQAIRIAGVIDYPEPRAQAFAAIAGVQARFGRGDQARESLRLARQAVFEASAFARVEGLMHVARGQELAGMSAESEATRDEAAREQKALVEAAGTAGYAASLRLIRAGDFVGALRVADGIDETLEAMKPTKQVAYLAIANEAARLGREALALDALKQAEALAPRDPANGLPQILGVDAVYTHGLVQARLARIAAKAGRRDEALDRLARVDAIIDSLAGTPVNGFYVGTTAVPARWSLGDEEAVAVARERNERLLTSLSPKAAKTYRVWEMRELAEGGMAEAARKILASVEREAKPTANNLLVLAEARLAMGDAADAYAAIRESTVTQVHRPILFRQIAHEMTRTGKARTVLDWAEAEADPAARVAALVGLLDGLAERRIGR